MLRDNCSLCDDSANAEDVPDHEAESSVTPGSSFKDIVSRRSDVSARVGVESATVTSDLSSESSEPVEELFSAPTTVVAFGPSFTYFGGTQVVKKPVDLGAVGADCAENIPVSALPTSMDSLTRKAGVSSISDF